MTVVHGSGKPTFTGLPFAEHTEHESVNVDGGAVVLDAHSDEVIHVVHDATSNSDGRDAIRRCLSFVRPRTKVQKVCVQQH